MIFSHVHRFVFIHIPRTGGMALTHALCSSPIGKDVMCDNVSLRHATALDLRRMLGDSAFRDYRKFAVVRPPWEIVKSDYELTLMNLDRSGADLQTSAPYGWQIRLRRAACEPGLAEFWRREYLRFGSVKPGGFWKTWCCDEEGNDLGVEPLPFDDFGIIEIAMSELLGVQIEVEHRNAAPKRVTTDDELRDEIKRHCRYDCERFGFA